MSDPQEPTYSTRRELVGATLVGAGAALVLGILWLVSRAAPSATRDPFMTRPEIVPTPTPPIPATPAATPKPRLRRRTRRQRTQARGTPEAGGAASS